MGHIFTCTPLAADVLLRCIVLLFLLCLGSLWSFVLVSTCSFVLGLMSLRPSWLLLIVAVASRHCSSWIVSWKEYGLSPKSEACCVAESNVNRPVTTRTRVSCSPPPASNP